MAKIVFLGVEPSFLEGISRIVDIGGTLRDEYIVVRSDRGSKRRRGRSKLIALAELAPLVPQNDAESLAKDWKAVGGDLGVAAKKLVEKHSSST